MSTTLVQGSVHYNFLEVVKHFQSFFGVFFEIHDYYQWGPRSIKGRCRNFYSSEGIGDPCGQSLNYSIEWKSDHTQKQQHKPPPPREGRSSDTTISQEYYNLVLDLQMCRVGRVYLFRELGKLRPIHICQAKQMNSGCCSITQRLKREENKQSELALE